MKPLKRHFTAQEEDLSLRLDKVLTLHYPDRSRQYFQKLFDEGLILVNGKAVKPSAQLKAGARVQVTFPPPEALNLKAVEMDLDIVYEDNDLLVVNKPPGLVVHPGEGGAHIDSSLVNALLHHCKGKLAEINGVMRPGIVHRLDKDTSGLLVVAKSDRAHRWLAERFENREIEKVYYALLIGHLEPDKGMVEAPIGRDPNDRKRMAVVDERKGKMAITRYEVIEYIGEFTYLKVRLITGRTHQIRVHFASIGFPLAGDDLYGRPGINNKLRDQHGLTRQFLHAGFLGFQLPGTKKQKNFKCPLPKDLQSVLDSLRAG